MEPSYTFARKMAKKIIKDYKLTEVPTSLEKIFQSLGLKYVELNDLEDIDGAILEIDGKPAIAVLNKAKSIPRQRFTLAHELGHIFLKHKQRDLYVPEEERGEEECEEGKIRHNKKPSVESEADAFASELLIPFDQIKKLYNETGNIDMMAEIFQVSKQAMAVAIMNYLKYFRNKKH